MITYVVSYETNSGDGHKRIWCGSRQEALTHVSFLQLERKDEIYIDTIKIKKSFVPIRKKELIRFLNIFADEGLM